MQPLLSCIQSGAHLNYFRYFWVNYSNISLIYMYISKKYSICLQNVTRRSKKQQKISFIIIFMQSTAKLHFTTVIGYTELSYVPPLVILILTRQIQILVIGRPLMLKRKACMVQKNIYIVVRIQALQFLLIRKIFEHDGRP